VSVLERGLLPHEICKLCLSALDAVVNKFMCMFVCESVCCKKGFDLPENAISSRAPWSPISQTSKNSKFKVSKNSKKIS
jgi:hypothetical protein